MSAEAEAEAEAAAPPSWAISHSLSSLSDCNTDPFDKSHTRVLAATSAPLDPRPVIWIGLYTIKTETKTTTIVNPTTAQLETTAEEPNVSAKVEWVKWAEFKWSKWPAISESDGSEVFVRPSRAFAYLPDLHRCFKNRGTILKPHKDRMTFLPA
ncbi:hypothetical protein DM02DRAFT_221500 [Periconia macrospinosa]|uniref:Uncharacterized protein n=1 Tax=Periconia macrospinosa TaxID=97972 RepID=A0A2V1D8R6_9PLEO|nr:hypothetical protein DM02DRAFT_221500 [Periconia macrospinosa]